MDDDHNVAVVDVEAAKTLSRQKGGKKVILKIGWTDDNNFVTAGLNHFKLWSFEKNKLTVVGDARPRGNLVSLAVRDNLVLTGAEKGIIYSWRGKSK